jgi:hypothetical protein
MTPAEIILNRLDQLTAARGWPLVRTGDLRRAVEQDGVAGEVFNSTMLELEAQDLVDLFGSGAVPAATGVTGAIPNGREALSHVALAGLV